MLNSFEIRLRNAEGIPVIQLGGTISKTALRAVKSTMDRLASAGHYNIIINVERVQSINWRFLTALGGTINNIRGHYGCVDLVVNGEAFPQLQLLNQITTLFRLCVSEGQAISMIKGIRMYPDAISTTNARLTEI